MAYLKGQEFNFQEKYATVLAFIFLVLAYCGPVPILLPLLAGYFHIWYLTDKFIFCNFCRIPPQYDNKMHELAMSILPFSLLLHIVFNIYAYGNSSLFPLRITAVTNEYTNQTYYTVEKNNVWVRITSVMGAPFFSLFLFIILAFILEATLLRLIAWYRWHKAMKKI